MLLADNFSIIPSIRKMKEFEFSLKSKSKYILLSEIHIGNLKSLVDKCHENNKLVMVNIELIGGFSADRIGLKLLKDFYKVDIIISANAMKINMGKSLGFETIQRFFLIDSRSFDSTLKSLQTTKNDAIEILPGPMAPEFIKIIKSIGNVPMIAGGFINTREMVEKIYESGFSGITSSNTELWNLRF
jgi:glycerol uptake operon antiterminator